MNWELSDRRAGVPPSTTDVDPDVWTTPMSENWLGLKIKTTIVNSSSKLVKVLPFMALVNKKLSTMQTSADPPPSPEVTIGVCLEPRQSRPLTVWI